MFDLGAMVSVVGDGGNAWRGTMVIIDIEGEEGF